MESWCHMNVLAEHLLQLPASSFTPQPTMLSVVVLATSALALTIRPKSAQHLCLTSQFAGGSQYSALLLRDCVANNTWTQDANKFRMGNTCLGAGLSTSPAVQADPSPQPHVRLRAEQRRLRRVLQLRRARHHLAPRLGHRADPRREPL